MSDDFFEQFLRFASFFGLRNDFLADDLSRLQPEARNLALSQISLVRNSPAPSARVSWHFCLYLYHLGRILAREGYSVDATVPFLVNKLCNGIDLYYEVNLGSSFAVAHTTGCVFAKANYSEYFAFHQNVTVGRYLDFRPTFESDVVMYPGSMVIGQCTIRRNTVISAGTKVIGRSTPGNCVVFERKSGSLKFRALDRVWTDSIFYRLSDS